MTAADVVVGTPAVLKQLTGRRDEQYDPFPTVGVMNDTLDIDLHGTDIGVTWPLGYDDKFCVWLGDTWGSTWTGSQFTLMDLSNSASATVHATQPTRTAGSFLGRGGGLDTLIVSDTAGFTTARLVCVNCDGSEGWSVFRFGGMSVGVGSFIFEEVEYLGGDPTGSVVAGLAVADGDPRPHGTYRGNGVGISDDTDLSAGINLAFHRRTAGFASGYLMEGVEFASSDLDLGEVFPFFPHLYNPAISGPVFGVTKIERVAGQITFTSAGHGQANTGPRPRGPIVYVGGAPSTTLLIGAGHTTASSTITLAAGYTTAGLSVAGAPSDDRRFVVLNTLGQVVKFAYTGLGAGGTTITGVTLLSGSGTLATNAQLIQGVDDINLTLQQVWDYPTSGQIRAQGTFGAGDRIGGTASFCFLHVPNIDVSSPATSPRNGYLPLGGFSAAHVGGHMNRRQFIAMYNSTYGAFCTSVDYLYTDDDLESDWPVHTGPDRGFTWTRAGSWVNDTDGTGPVQGVCFFDDPANVMGGGASTYKYAYFSPGSFIGRIPLASAHTFSAWEYWTGSTWSSSIASAARVTTFDTFFWGAVNETSTSVSIQYDADLGCFVMMYSYGLVINLRFADDPRGAWTTRRALSLPTAPNTNPIDTSFGSNQGYQYGGFMLHPTPSTPTGRKRFVFTQFKPYQLYEAEVPLVGAPPVPGEDLTMRNDSTDRQSKTGQKFRGPTIDRPITRRSDGWYVDDKTWQIVDSLTIRCADATADVATYLAHLDPGSINDGTAVRYFYVDAVTNDGTNTTVTLIPHSDGASAGNVLTTGGSVSAFRYSKMNRPLAFPERFTYTPTWANVTTTSATIAFKYAVRNGRVFVDFKLTFGASTAFTGGPTFTNPVVAHADYTNALIDPVQSNAFLRDASGSESAFGKVQILTSTTSRVVFDAVSVASRLITGVVSPTSPWTWAVSDLVSGSYNYRAA